MSLLLGHIQLHGLQQPEQAAISYERVLQRCRSGDIASEAGTTPATNGAIPDLLKDPFLKTDPDQTRPTPVDVVTAMPWLTSDVESLTMPTPDPSRTAAPLQAPVPSPEPTVTPAANSDVEKQEPEPTADEPPLDTIEPAPQPQEAAGMKLLENSWLRVQLQPYIKSPTDSMEPMGLI